MCKIIKCNHFKENKCSLASCIYSVAEKRIRVEREDTKEFYLFLLKFAGTMALTFFLSVILMSIGGYI